MSEAGAIVGLGSSPLGIEAILQLACSFPPARDVSATRDVSARGAHVALNCQGMKNGLSAAYHLSATICEPAGFKWTPSEKSDGSNPV